MAEVPLSEAAARLGVSVDTIRRRLRSGELAGRQVGRRTLVTLPAEFREPPPELAGDLVAELRAQRAELLELSRGLMRLLETEAQQRSDLHRLLGRTLDTSVERTHS